MNTEISWATARATRPNHSAAQRMAPTFERGNAGTSSSGESSEQDVLSRRDAHLPSLHVLAEPPAFLTPPKKEGQLASKAVGLLLRQGDLQRLTPEKDSWTLRQVNRSFYRDFFGGLPPSRATMVRKLGALAHVPAEHCQALVTAGRKAMVEFVPDADPEQFHPVIFNELLSFMRSTKRAQGAVAFLFKQLQPETAPQDIYKLFPVKVPTFSISHFTPPGDRDLESLAPELYLMPFSEIMRPYGEYTDTVRHLTQTFQSLIDSERTSIEQAKYAFQYH